MLIGSMLIDGMLNENVESTNTMLCKKTFSTRPL